MKPLALSSSLLAIVSRPKSFPEALPVLNFRFGIPRAEITL